MNRVASMAVSPHPGPVVVVGGINLDIQATSRAVFLRGDSNPGSVTMVPGGVGRNIAENLVRLGLETELVTVLGDDASSVMLKASCAELGVGLAGALILEGAACSHYICLLGPDGRLEGAVAAMDAFENLSVPFLETRRSLLDSASAIVVDANIPAASIGWLASNYGKPFDMTGPGISGAGSFAGDGTAGDTTTTGDRAAESVVSERAARRPVLFLDPVSVTKAERAAPFIGAFDCAKPNRAEAAVLAGMAPVPGSGTASGIPDNRMELAGLAGALHAKGLAQLVISLGSGGLFYSHAAAPASGDKSTGANARSGAGARTHPGDSAAGDRAAEPGADAISGIVRPGYVPVGPEGSCGKSCDGEGKCRPLPVVNVSGAGDAACAALVWATLAGYDLPSKVSFALAASELCASSPFTVHPGMAAALILEIAQGVTHESIS